MAAQFGRSVNKFVTVKIGDTGNVLRTLPVIALGDVGMSYEAVDASAWMDAVKGILHGQPDFKVQVTCLFDNTATTGSHTVLSALNGGYTPRTFDIQFGIQHAWEAGEPQFGISQSAGNGVIVGDYAVQPGNPFTCTFTLSMYAGSTAPAFGTAAET